MLEKNFRVEEGSLGLRITLLAMRMMFRRSWIEFRIFPNGGGIVTELSHGAWHEIRYPPSQLLLNHKRVYFISLLPVLHSHIKQVVSGIAYVWAQEDREDEGREVSANWMHSNTVEEPVYEHEITRQ